MKKLLKQFLLTKETLVSLDEKIMSSVKGGVTGYLSCADMVTTPAAGCTGACTTLSCGTGCTTGCTYPSDLRYKTNIEVLKNSLALVKTLRGVSYNWKREEYPEKGFTDNLQIGFIAQELEEVYPELVETDSMGYKSVNYALLTPVLVEGLKDQQNQIDNLVTKVNKLEQILARIQREMFVDAV